MKHLNTPVRLISIAILLSISMTVAANETQCVLNRGGFNARVKWYQPKDVVIVNGNKPYLKNKQVKPAQVKVLQASQESCVTGPHQMVATIAVVDGKAAKIATEVGLSAMLAVGTIGGCVVTGGMLCAGATELLPEAISATIQFMPDAKDLFYISVPNNIGSSKHRTIITGTVWNPVAKWNKM